MPSYTSTVYHRPNKRGDTGLMAVCVWESFNGDFGREPTAKTGARKLRIANHLVTITITRSLSLDRSIFLRGVL